MACASERETERERETETEREGGRKHVWIKKTYKYKRGFPGGSDGKESA